MIKFVTSFLLVMSLSFVSVVQAQLAVDDPKQFIAYNPDGKKYEFVKYYIKAIDYLYRNEQTHQSWATIDPAMLATNFSAEAVKKLTQENVNLRIARNLLKPYASSPNRLMVKVVDIFTIICDELAQLNNQEKDLLTKFINTYKPETSSQEDVKAFFISQQFIANKRREASLQLLVATMLVEKIMVSVRQDDAGKFIYLGMSKAERDKLKDLLKQYKGANFEGELREGQSFMEASVAQIRSVLTNSNYLTIDK